MPPTTTTPHPKLARLLPSDGTDRPSESQYPELEAGITGFTIWGSGFGAEHGNWKAALVRHGCCHGCKLSSSSVACQFRSRPTRSWKPPLATWQSCDAFFVPASVGEGVSHSELVQGQGTLVVNFLDSQGGYVKTETCASRVRYCPDFTPGNPTGHRLVVTSTASGQRQSASSSSSVARLAEQTYWLNHAPEAVDASRLRFLKLGQLLKSPPSQSGLEQSSEGQLPHYEPNDPLVPEGFDQLTNKYDDELLAMVGDGDTDDST